MGRSLAALVFAVAVSPAMPVSAHGGGLDAYGCHHNRKQGGYHCHRGEHAGKHFASQAEMLGDDPKPSDRASGGSPGDVTERRPP